MNWEEIKTTGITFFQTSGLNILKAIGILLIGLVAIKIIVTITKKVFRKTKMEKAAQGFLTSIIKVVLYLVLLFVIASVLGINTTGLVAVVSTAGLALSLALQSSLSNLANGVVLIATHPFREGDYVAIGSIEGTVKALEMTHTILVTPDNKIISIPNSTVISNEITNYNVLGTRRLSFDFSVDYATDIEKAKKVINDVLYSNGKIKLDPSPSVALNTLGDSAININAKCWVDSEDYWDMYFYITENVFNEFKRNNINIPYNQIEVRMRTDEVISPVIQATLPQRVEKAQKKVVDNDPWKKILKKTSERRNKNKEKKQKRQLNKNNQKEK